jgi:predicted transcriptional regulator/transcriptional regulator with XRE-family HTH domain
MTSPRLGTKIKSLRRREGITQAELARRLEISSSYLNLIENNKRPLTAALLIRLAQQFDVDLGAFASDDDARLVGELMEVLSDPLFDGHRLKGPDVREFVDAAPTAARAMRTLYRQYVESSQTTRDLAEQVTEGQDMSEQVAEGQDVSPRHSNRLPPEEVSDLIQANRNFFGTLEDAAERLRRDANLDETNLIYHDLVDYLHDTHGVTVIQLPIHVERGAVRRYDPKRHTLTLSALLDPGGTNFQLTHQIGLLEASDAIDDIIDAGHLTSPQSIALARVALANYFAGAVMMPYAPLLAEAEAVGYDVELISRKFKCSFEQVCHRLTCLRKPGAEGVAFHFIRVDIAGNISKRFSASGVPFARFSGACPRWALFLAFHTPGVIRTQLSEMPNGQRYFCLTRTVNKTRGGFRARPTLQAVCIGCKAEDAHRLVYAEHLDMTSAPAIPIGVTCRLCERTQCSDRAFPSLTAPLNVDENVRGPNLYSGG